MIGQDRLFAVWLKDFLQEQRLPAAFGGLVERLHVPLAEAIVRAAKASHGLFVVGLCGPQGAGKSTMTEVLCRLIEREGLRPALLSIDDLYLTRAAREALAREVHPLLLTRGPPGTHDVTLGRSLIAALRRGEVVRMPRFDKARDDRRSPAEIAPTAAPDVLLLEGWCVGARPQSARALAAPINPLERDEDGEGIWRAYVNRALAADYPALWAEMDALVALVAPGWEAIARWREEQEAKLRARPGGSGGSRVMSSDQVARFIQHYERITRAIAAEMPARADIVIRLDEDRQPVSVAARSGGRLAFG